MSSSHTIDPHSPRLCPVHLLEQREGISHQDLLTAFPEKNLKTDKKLVNKDYRKMDPFYKCIKEFINVYK